MFSDNRNLDCEGWFALAITEALSWWAAEMASPIVLWYHGVALGQGNEVTWLSGEDGYDRDRHHYEGKYPGNWQSVSDEEVFEPESAKLRTSSARRGC